MNSVLTGCLLCVEYLLRQENVDATIPEKDGEWPLLVSSPTTERGVLSVARF